MSDYLIKCLWKGVADVDQQQDAAERIEQLAANNEELEAKLAKAVEALREISSESMGEDGCYYTNRVNISCARTTLAELKGQDDE